MQKEPLDAIQVRAIRFSDDKAGCYLAMDMGIGKTRIALNWCRKNTGATLIIAPIITIHTTWPDEVAKWGFPYSYTILHGPTKNRDLFNKTDLYITNFESVKWLFEELKTVYKITKRVPFSNIIIDEGSKIKSHSTKRFKTLRKYTDMFKRKLLLSGTPAPNSLLDLWSQYFFLDKGVRLEKSYGHYRNKYFVQADYMGFSWDLPEENKVKIYKRIQDITFRVEKVNDVKRVDNPIRLKMPDKAVKQYNELMKKCLLTIESSEIEALNAASLSMKLRQMVQGAIYSSEDRSTYEVIHMEKIKAIKEIVDTSEVGILCAIQFRFELELIQKAIPGTPYIAGGISLKDKTELVRRWNRKELPLLLCHPASLSHGVNLQQGSHILLWAGLPWSSEQYLQFIKRLQRRGQKNTVINHQLIMKGTVDEAVLSALKAKIKGQNELLNYIRDYHQEKGLLL